PPTRQADWRSAISQVAGAAFAVHTARHGSAPATRAEPDAIALAAAFGVQRAAHASAATNDVDPRSLGPGRPVRTSVSLAGAPPPLLTNLAQRRGVPS